MSKTEKQEIAYLTLKALMIKLGAEESDMMKKVCEKYAHYIISEVDAYK